MTSFIRLATLSACLAIPTSATSMGLSVQTARSAHPSPCTKSVQPARASFRVTRVAAPGAAPRVARVVRDIGQRKKVDCDRRVCRRIRQSHRCRTLRCQ
jgi:hypothetical protein